MKKLILFLIIGSGFSSWAQEDETMRILETDRSKLMGDTLWTPHDQPTLMIVPFEPIMYKSQIDRSIGAVDGTNFDQIRENFRRGLDNLLYIETDQQYSVIKLLGDDAEKKVDLFKIYASSAPEYQILPKEKAPPKKVKLNFLNKAEEDKPKKAHGTKMESGQIKSENDGEERFMARAIRDSSIFDIMYEKYGTVLYLFINQFDLGPMPGLDYRSFESEEYQREIKIHYSIYTHKKEIYSGVSKAWFSSTLNSQKDIILQAMPALSSEIAKNLPVLISEQ